MTRIRRLRAQAPTSLAAVFATMAIVLFAVAPAGRPVAATAVATTPPPAVELSGEGAWGPYQELVPWQNDLESGAQPIDMEYVSTGDQLGREDFVNGGLDYVISGVPFLPSELSGLKGDRADLIDAPIQVTATGFLLSPPVPTGFQTIHLLCNPYDPTITDPSQCIQTINYTGPIRVPNDNLAAMIFRYAGSGQIPLSSWNDPDVLSANGVDNFTTPPLAGPSPVVRSDPSADDYYLQEFAKIGAPTVWAGLKAQDTRIQWEPITERLGAITTASREGVDQQSLQLGLGADPSSGAVTEFSAGIVAPVPPSAEAEVQEAFPHDDLQFIEMQNADKQWVAPTPTAIDDAVDAGGDTPLYALTNPVPDAYPLVWVNHLYAPAKGLSIAKTEALATMIRYLATAGQAAALPVGEGQLSKALVDQALAAANQLVESNCIGSDRQITISSDPGPDAPPLAAMKSIGPMKHCVAKSVPPATTTTVAPTTTSPDLGLGDTLPFDSGPISCCSDNETPTVVAPAAVATTVPPTTMVPRAVSKKPPPTTIQLVSSNLAMPPPASKSGGYDRLAALLLGAALYLMARSPASRLLRRIRG